MPLPVLEMLKIKTLMISNAGEDMKQKELSVTAGENAKYFSHFEW